MWAILTDEEDFQTGKTVETLESILVLRTCKIQCWLLKVHFSQKEQKLSFSKNNGFRYFQKPLLYGGVFR